MIYELNKLDIGGVPEAGGIYAPYKKNEDGVITIDTGRNIHVAPGDELPEVPNGYDDWVKISEI